MVPISQVMEKMIAYSNGNLHDISHFIKVWGYAKTIGELEALDANTQYLLELAAITHDIACPLCREKYGNTNGRLQEQEGALLVAGFLTGMGLTEKQLDRIVFLVGRHHTYTDVDGPDCQILLEADYLVNAEESRYPPENLRSAYHSIFKTDTGKRLLQTVYSW